MKAWEYRSMKIWMVTDTDQQVLYLKPVRCQLDLRETIPIVMMQTICYIQIRYGIWMPTMMGLQRDQLKRPVRIPDRPGTYQVN